jgi:hypothetical protein
VIVAALLASCATGAPGALGTPDPDAAARLETATAPAHRLHVIFDWNLVDREIRFSGRGVLRLDRGQRARVDLFTPQGEAVAAAIIEGTAMRVAPAAASAMLPPPALLWGTIGAFRAPADAPLTGTSAGDGSTVLEYVRDGTRWRFRFQDDTLRHTEWTTAAGGRRTVELRGAAAFGLPAEASFRDWTEFRELTLRVTDIEETTGFDPDAWILPGER